MIEKKTIPVAVKRVEQNNIATRRLNGGGVERLPSVVEPVVVGICALRIGTKFLFGLVGQTVSVRVSVGALVGVRPRFGFVFNLSLTGGIVLGRIDLNVVGFTVVKRIESVLHLPPVTHPVVVRVPLLRVGTVLGFFQFVRKTVFIAVNGLRHEFGVAADVLLNSALKSPDFFTGLEKP